LGFFLIDLNVFLVRAGKNCVIDVSGHFCNMESRLVRMVLVVVFSVVFVGGSACAERGRGDGRSIRKAMDFLAR